MTNHIQRNPWLATRTRTGSEYDAPYAARAAAGQDIHGEANFLIQLFAEQLPARVPERGRAFLMPAVGQDALQLNWRSVVVRLSGLISMKKCSSRRAKRHRSWCGSKVIWQQ